MQLDQFADQREAETETLLGSIARPFSLAEALEHVRQELRGDPAAGIPDRDVHFVRHATDRDPDASARRGELDRVQE